ncbi:L,D-transpeptidase family protein [Secundilactobacillus collinoides]|uniref:L,D-TPase catalytic domain-containing protein n=2 Tax=Secundilactobacillus collinoides TaxID=33960 RepID=A0A0R2BE15_SECCO|nr:L,D-transpeptidase family protein [Secundilactobacillus collinoides]KRM73923.1 hypothetical protein FC82_GL000887 [Secundilactobacillus collinoides DSM 20515 = JCM 1123]KZL41682.1 hypothetical protein TY91_05555 [Secundilactobacillus collinoides]
MKHTKRWLFTGIAVIAIAGLGYVARANHFQTHFLNNTEIDGINVGGQTAGAAAETINVKLSHQVYTVTDQSKILTTFTAKEIGITPYTANQIKQLISNQNAYAWPAHMTRASANSHRLGLKAINKAKLSAVSNRVVRLANNAKRTPTRNAKLVYNNQSFVIKRQVYGQQVNRDSVKQSVTNAVANHQSQIDLKTAYIKPTILQSNASLKKARQTAIKLSTNKITYTLANHSVTIPESEIASWLTTKNARISVSKKAVESYLTKLSYKYGTIHKTRHFKTYSGAYVNVPAGLYGWHIKVTAETPRLSKFVLAGKPVTRTPVLQGTGYHKNGQDIGTTYVEVSKSSQHMWVHKNGNVIISTDVVTGKPPRGTTPSGVYVVWSKQRNATLRGQNDDGSDYASPVSYWMPVDATGVGIHDSPWQPQYGGTWYVSHGSHGCVNTPPSVMAKVYANVPLKTPVIIY